MYCMSLAYIRCTVTFRWNTVGWPKKISDQIEITEDQLEENEKKFQKNLQNDQSNFEDRIDTLEVRE